MFVAQKISAKMMYATMTAVPVVLSRVQQNVDVGLTGRRVDGLRDIPCSEKHNEEQQKADRENERSSTNHATGEPFSSVFELFSYMADAVRTSEAGHWCDYT